MKFWIPMIIILLVIPLPVSAVEVTAPHVPDSGAQLMPDDTASFGDAFVDLLQNALKALRPDLQKAIKIGISISASVIAVSILQTLSGKLKTIGEVVGCVSIAGILLSDTNTMLHLGATTISEMSEYGKLLYPVMTAALAAQGGISTSAALYTGTMAFTSILAHVISTYLLPVVYVFLALATAYSATSEPVLKRLSVILKTAIAWCLKTLLTVFTTFLSITGVISGTTDAAALKAAKVTISSIVPVVGGILSDASESVLVSASIAKNAAGIYGLIAVLAVFLGPFLKIGAHYIVLKFTSLICEIMGTKNATSLIDDFSSAMGLILAMTGSVCLLLMISTVCYMKGAG